MRISLCAIVRDEAANLGRCLASLSGVVDELCVLDTGSSDGTLELARGLGARVESFAWCDDFAAARNASLELASGDWVLVLDADEELVADGARGRLEAFAAAHPEALGRVRISNEGDAGEESCSGVTRFFPRLRELRFRGRVHEQLVDTGRERERLDSGVQVLHHGYSAEALAARDKLARNRALLEGALEEQPAEAYLWYQLCRTEFVAGRHEAARRAGLRSLELLGGASTPYLAILVETTAYALRQLGRSAQAHALLERIAERFARRPDTRFALALCAMDLGRLAEAEAGFRACLELEGGSSEGGESTRSSSTWAPAFNLGVMHEVLEHLEQAARWYERALAFRPGHQASREALARCGYQ